jgi:ABC-2 type transport system permease protein
MRIKENWISFKTILVKEIVRFTRIWVQTIFPPAITITLYFVIFGRMVGSQVGEIDGFSYMQYIVPGLIMMSVVTSSYMNVVSSFFSAKFQKSIEELLVSPVPASIVIAGFVAGGVVRGLLVGAIVTAVALFFTSLQISHPFTMLVVVLFSAIFFSLAGFVNAVFAKKFDDISIIPTFVLTPLTYLGGIFYSIKLLSPFWQNVSMANPLLYIINAFRFGVLGISDINVNFAVVMLLSFTVMMYCVCMYLLRTGYGLRP